LEKSPASVFENAAVVVLPDLCAALRQLLLTRLLPCGRVYGVRAIRFLVSSVPAELPGSGAMKRNHRRTVIVCAELKRYINYSQRVRVIPVATIAGRAQRFS
jgi:hypothetical protein